MLHKQVGTEYVNLLNTYLKLFSFTLLKPYITTSTWPAQEIGR